MDYSTTYSTQGGNEAANAAAAVFFGIYFLALFAVTIVSIIGLWHIYKKAQKPGWAAIVPIYNMIVWCDIVGRPRWWVALLFVPFVSIVISVILSLDLAKSFGKSDGYGALVFFFSFVMYPIMGFSKDIQYTGPSALQTTPAGTTTPPKA